MKTTHEGNPKLRTATAARAVAIMFAGMIILIGQSQSVLAQYGPRCWSPPPMGNFYSLQHGGTNFVPIPFMPFDPIGVPVYPVLGTTNSFVFDDTLMDLSTSDVPSPPGEGGTNDPPPSYVRTYGSNDLWIELLSVDTTNLQANLTLHGTVLGYYYELLRRPDLAQPWNFAPFGVIYDSTGTNQMYFDPVATGARSQTFYAAAKGYPLVSIQPKLYFGAGVEPNTNNNDPGSIAGFTVTLSPALSSNLTVVYAISGSASNNVDYTNIADRVTVAAGDSSADIIIQPKEDDIVEFTETVKLTWFSQMDI